MLCKDTNVILIEIKIYTICIFIFLYLVNIAVVQFYDIRDNWGIYL